MEQASARVLWVVELLKTALVRTHSCGKSSNGQKTKKLERAERRDDRLSVGLHRPTSGSPKTERSIRALREGQILREQILSIAGEMIMARRLPGSLRRCKYVHLVVMTAQRTVRTKTEDLPRVTLNSVRENDSQAAPGLALHLNRRDFFIGKSGVSGKEGCVAIGCNRYRTPLR